MFTHRRPGCPAFSGISGGDIGTTPPSSLEPVRVQLIAPRYPALAPPSADPSSGLRGGASVARICFVGPRLVPYGQRKAADLQNRSALHVLANTTPRAPRRRGAGQTIAPGWHGHLARVKSWPRWPCHGF